MSTIGGASSLSNKEMADASKRQQVLERARTVLTSLASTPEQRFETLTELSKANLSPGEMLIVQDFMSTFNNSLQLFSNFFRSLGDAMRGIVNNIGGR